jgi:GTP-binding protein
MLQSLNAQCLASAGSRFTLQAIITKADAISSEEVSEVIPKMRKQIFEAAPVCLPPIITSAFMKPQFGIEETRKSIMEACGLGNATVVGSPN